MDEVTVAPYREIQLTQGQVALVDPEDYERIAAHKWFAAKDHKTGSFYAGRNSPRTAGRRITIYMAREVMSAAPGILVDHVNHHTLDNRKINLRLATNQQNSFNRRIRKDNTTGLKGVFLVGKSRINPWKAFIGFNGKQIYLGSFKTPKEAYMARLEAAAEYHGEFFYSG